MALTSFLTHNSASCLHKPRYTIARQAMLCLSSLYLTWDWTETLFLLEKEQSLRYKFESHEQRDDIESQMNRCSCPKAEAEREKPWGNNLENRSKIRTMQRRVGINNREERNEISFWWESIWHRGTENEGIHCQGRWPQIKCLCHSPISSCMCTSVCICVCSNPSSIHQPTSYFSTSLILLYCTS